MLFEILCTLCMLYIYKLNDQNADTEMPKWAGIVANVSRSI